MLRVIYFIIKEQFCAFSIVFTLSIWIGMLVIANSVSSRNSLRRVCTVGIKLAILDRLPII